VTRLSYPLVLAANAPDCYTVQCPTSIWVKHKCYTATASAIEPLIGRRDTHTIVCLNDAQVLRQTVGSFTVAVHARMAAFADAVDVCYGVI
jgi:hypothetical protein